MSLVNSMINQIGREMGRDLYWSTRQSLTPASGRSGRTAARARQMQNDSVNQNLLLLVTKKSWSPRMRFNAMILDIQETIDLADEQIDGRSFDWKEIYAELDNKIDDLKLTCKEEEASLLEELDKKNFASFSVTKSRHKSWIRQVLDSSPEPEKAPSSLLIFVLSIAGLTSRPLKRGWLNTIAEILCALVWWTFIVFGYNYIQDESEFKNGLILLGIGLGFYTLVLIGNLIALSDLRKSIQHKIQRRQELQSYYNGL
jgi:hypothetical protein